MAPSLPIAPDAESRSGPSPPPPRFIVVTGCHGVGKSTVAEALAGPLGAAVLQYPFEFVRFRERVGLDTDVAALPRLLYYLGATLHLSDLVQRELPRRPVVCDRYLESPLALLIGEGVFDEADLARICGPFLPHLCRPGVTLLLTAAHEAASHRMQGRGQPHSATQQHMLRSPGFYAACEGALRTEAARLGPMLELDTTHLSPEAMCAAARALIGDFYAS
jgi:thymidylate kinase